MKKKHSKHSNLAKPELGAFGRNEWSFLGAPCDVIKCIATDLMELSTHRMIYIDESHHPEQEIKRAGSLTKIKNIGVLQDQLEWEKNSIYQITNDKAFVLVNGNHFLAEKQIVILNERKKESLSRKLDRLTNVRAFIVKENDQRLYDFLDDGKFEDVPRILLHDRQALLNLIVGDAKVPPLKALILAGGKSVRMGTDKGQINYHGKRQAEYLYQMAMDLGLDPHISCRQDQVDQYTKFNRITDQFIGLGPFGAIASALMEDPNAAWFALPCDLPLLNKEHLIELIRKRDPHKFATAYKNNDTQFPEPLISIWEPRMYQQMLKFLSLGYSCPRKTLINSDIELVEIQDQHFMMNVNTPEEKVQAEQILEQGSNG